jgi:hypothetical protein
MASKEGLDETFHQMDLVPTLRLPPTPLWIHLFLHKIFDKVVESTLTMDYRLCCTTIHLQFFLAECKLKGGS